MEWSESHSSQWKWNHFQAVQMEEGVWQCHHLRDIKTEICAMCVTAGAESLVLGRRCGHNGVPN